MSKKKILIILGIVVIAISGGAFFLLRPNKEVVEELSYTPKPGIEYVDNTDTTNESNTNPWKEVDPEAQVNILISEEGCVLREAPYDTAKEVVSVPVGKEVGLLYFLEGEGFEDWVKVFHYDKEGYMPLYVYGDYSILSQSSVPEDISGVVEDEPVEESIPVESIETLAPTQAPIVEPETPDNTSASVTPNVEVKTEQQAQSEMQADIMAQLEALGYDPSRQVGQSVTGDGSPVNISSELGITLH